MEKTNILFNELHEMNKKYNEKLKGFSFDNVEELTKNLTLEELKQLKKENQAIKKMTKKLYEESKITSCLDMISKCDKINKIYNIIIKEKEWMA